MLAARANRSEDQQLLELLSGRLSAKRGVTLPEEPLAPLTIPARVVDAVTQRAMEDKITPPELVARLILRAIEETREVTDAARWLPKVTESFLIAAAVALCAGSMGRDLAAAYFRQTEKPSELARPDPATIRIPGGQYHTGCKEDPTCDELERKASKVRISSYEIDRTEVTVADYRLCVLAGVCVPPSSSAKGSCNYDTDGTLPMNCVTHGSAETFCRWIGRRLPSDAEWEIAAAGEKGNAYPWGNQDPGCAFDKLVEGPSERPQVSDGRRACIAPERGRGSIDTPPDVSEFGLVGMGGSLLEWTRGSFETELSEGTESTMRSLRGGKTYRRHGAASFVEHELVGFRCARRSAGPSSGQTLPAL